MNNWIKPTELPNDFWQECFVSIYDGVDILTEINWVKVVNDKAFWYSETQLEWFSFRPDIEARIFVIEYPKITQEYFK